MGVDTKNYKSAVYDKLLRVTFKILAVILVAILDF